jgi:hypothetical protein
VPQTGRRTLPLAPNAASTPSNVDIAPTEFVWYLLSPLRKQIAHSVVGGVPQEYVLPVCLSARHPWIPAQVDSKRPPDSHDLDKLQDLVVISCASRYFSVQPLKTSTMQRTILGADDRIALQRALSELKNASSSMGFPPESSSHLTASTLSIIPTFFRPPQHQRLNRSDIQDSLVQASAELHYARKSAEMIDNHELEALWRELERNSTPADSLRPLNS